MSTWKLFQKLFCTIFMVAGVGLPVKLACTSPCENYASLQEKWKEDVDPATDCGSSLQIDSDERHQVASCLLSHSLKCTPAFGELLTGTYETEIPILTLRSFFVLHDCSVIVVEPDQDSEGTNEFTCDSIMKTDDILLLIVGGECSDPTYHPGPC